MRKTIILISTILAVGVAATAADAKGLKKKRSNYSAAQQKALFERGLALCRKKYGGEGVGHVEVDYAHNSFVCYE